MTHAVTGIRAMPAKGGDPSLSEANIKDSMVYMLDETGIKTDTAPAPLPQLQPRLPPRWLRRRSGPRRPPSEHRRRRGCSGPPPAASQ